jgi:glycosyltransferase involved in cell wall biosynthesis
VLTDIAEAAVLPMTTQLYSAAHKTPLLSVTIPTFNRAQRLQQCLQMLVERLAEIGPISHEIEILVVDNASTDETSEIAKLGYTLFANFRYERNDSNLGIDGNIHRCSQLATGQWVQFLSDDDILLPGALLSVLETIKSRPTADFIFLNVVSFVDTLPPLQEWKARIPLNADLVCTDQNQLVETCHIWLTFLTSFVFRREAWNRSRRLESYIGTDIYLSYALLDLLSGAAESVILAKPLVAARAHFSGSYRIFYAFGHQWTDLLLQHAPMLGFDRERMRNVLRKTIRMDFLYRVVMYRVKQGELSTAERQHVMHAIQGVSTAEIALWLGASTPAIVLRTTFNCLRSLSRTVKAIKQTRF